MDAELLKALLGAAGGALATWFGLHWKIRKELLAQYDRDLRDRRLAHYARLWALMEPVARYAPPGPVTADTLERLAVQLRHWYFHDGGLYLSDHARDAYFALQEGIVDALAALASDAAADQAPQRDGRKPDTPEGRVRAASSRLRSALVGDVGSRARPMLDGPYRA